MIRPHLRRKACPAAALAAMLVPLGLLPPPAQALRPVRVYEVTVHGDSSNLLADAMRAALVRATGSRDAPADPALAGLIANAAHYVQATRPLSDGATQVVFDGTALAADIAAAGRGVWDPRRPFTLVTLSPAPSGQAADGVRAQLEQAAEARGLPVTVVPLALTDAAGVPVADDTALQNARRLGADAVLIGRADPAAGGWSWRLVTGFTGRSWSGSLAAGIDGAADALAHIEEDAGAGTRPPEDVLVQIGGVASLNDYARVADILAQLPGVERAGLAGADGMLATFRLSVRGGAGTVDRALAGSPHLQPAADAGPLHFQYRP